MIFRFYYILILNMIIALGVVVIIVCSVVLIPHATTMAAQKNLKVAKSQSRYHKPVPVLLYHHIGNAQVGDGSDIQSLYITSTNFEHQLQFIQAHNYTTIPVNQLYTNRLYTSDPHKPIIITFDDGYTDNYVTAYPLLLKYGLKATFFVITDLINTENYMTWDQLREMQKNGMTIASHTKDHPHLKNLSLQDKKNEFLASKIIFKKELNINIVSVAYPYGEYDFQVVKQAQKAGYLYAFGTRPGYIIDSNNHFMLPRYNIVEGTNFNALLHEK